ncbi:MAG: hypothetical protein AB1324_01595 [Candidatus Micrarchaeota archaeon]
MNKFLLEIDYVNREKLVDLLSSLNEGLKTEVTIKKIERGPITTTSANVEGSLGHEIIAKAKGEIGVHKQFGQIENESTFSEQETDATLLRKLIVSLMNEKLLVHDDNPKEERKLYEFEGYVALSPVEATIHEMKPIKNELIKMITLSQNKNRGLLASYLTSLFADKENYFAIIKKPELSIIIKVKQAYVRERDLNRLTGTKKILGRLIQKSKDGQEVRIFEPPINFNKSEIDNALLTLTNALGREVTVDDIKVKHPFIVIEPIAIYQRDSV